MLICNPYEVIIQGITNKGKRFRPSDWSERLSGILSSFNTGRLSYHQYVRPMLIDQVRCVAVDKKLAEVNPEMFQFLMDFAHDNDLRIVDCKQLMQEQDTDISLEQAMQNEPQAQTSIPVTQAAREVLAAKEKLADSIQEVVEKNVVELEADETALAFAVMHELRPHLESEKMFAAQVDNILRPDGYRLVAIFVPGQEQAVAACGFRLAHNLAWGRHLWVEDLSRLESVAGQGYGEALLNWVKAEANRLGCKQIHANVTVENRGVVMQKLCLNTGFVLSHHHFTYFMK